MQIRHENILGKIVTWAILLIMLLFTLTPIIFMVSSSMMTSKQILRMPFNWIPEKFNWINFSKAIKGLDNNYIFLRNILNSLIVSTTVAITTVLLASRLRPGQVQVPWP